MGLVVPVLQNTLHQLSLENCIYTKEYHQTNFSISQFKKSSFYFMQMHQTQIGSIGSHNDYGLQLIKIPNSVPHNCFIRLLKGIDSEMNGLHWLYSNTLLILGICDSQPGLAKSDRNHLSNYCSSLQNCCNLPQTCALQECVITLQRQLDDFI